MFCEIRHPYGSIYQKDSRSILAQAEKAARKKNLKIKIGSEIEFYLFKTDERGEPTKIPFDNAGFTDVAHKFIEKLAMDKRISSREAAELIIDNL